MAISYNYFLPTKIYGTLQVTDLGFPGYTAVNANIYCQRNINSDGQMQCGSFKSLGASSFDQVPTCITNATTATQLTNYQTVQALITASGGITAQQAIDAVHASSQQFTVPQNIWNTLTIRAAGGSPSTTVLQHSDTTGYFIFTNTTSTGHYRFNVNTAGVQSSVLEMDSTLFIVRAGTVQLNLTTVNALTCSNNATFNGAFPTTTLGSNSGLNNNEFATVGYAKSIGGTSILPLNNTFTATNTFESNVTNEMIINIPSTFINYNGSIGFIPACTANYLNLTTELFDSMMFIGQPIAKGIDKPYGFTIGDYNSGGTGIRISGTGASGNCSVSLNASVFTTGLLTCNNGLFVNLGNIDNPNNSILGTVCCDIFNNYNQLTGTDITLNPNNFVQCVVNDGNNSILPTAAIGYGGLKIGWNCSNSIGETDFINLANFTNTGGFNFYTMNASNLPYLIGTLSFSGLTLNGNLTNNSIVNSSGTEPYFIQVNTMPLPTATSTLSGMAIGWNAINGGGTGECDLINYGQAGGGGGFNFSTITSTQTNRNLALISTAINGGFRVYSACGQMRLDDSNNGAFNTQLIQTNSQLFINSRGINTQIVLQCGNASAVTTNTLTMSAVSVQPLVNFSPQSTTAFNSSHPTTTLALPTLANQYATVGYVSSVTSPNLLPLNNIWTGTNEYKNTTNGIKTTAFGTVTSQYFGSGTGGATNLVIGGNSLATVNVLNAGNIAICPSPSASLGPNIGNSNIAIGNSCGIVQTNANQNIYIGTTCGNAVTSGSNNICLGTNAGNGVTTGSNNTVIGNSAWATTANFSNCTVIGASAPAPLSSNSIILGSTAETVYVQGASQLTNTLLIGTTVASNNFQVNGNIIQPVTLYTLGVATTFTNIPPFILFTPSAGMSFILPTPNGTNAGQQFIIRKIGAGGGQTINFSCTGNPAVWVNVNSGTGATSLNISTVWQFRFLSANNLYYQIA